MKFFLFLVRLNLIDRRLGRTDGQIFFIEYLRYKKNINRYTDKYFYSENMKLKYANLEKK